MNTKRLTILAAVAMLVIIISLSGLALASPATLEVGRGKPYTSIQAAVNAASNGDSILVYPGTYTERVSVTKEVTISAAQGRPRVEGGFEVNANNVTIKGFDIRAAAPYDVVAMYDRSHVTIRNNSITGGGPPPHAWPPPLPNAGISAIISDNVTIEENFIHLTTGAGIWLGGTSYSSIKNNHVVDTLYTGILLPDWRGVPPSHPPGIEAHHNTVVGNRVESSGNPWLVHDDGISHGINAHDNLVEENQVNGATNDGIRAVASAYNNTIQNNKAVGNSRYDIRDDQTTTPCDNVWIGNQFNTNYGCATD